MNSLNQPLLFDTNLNMDEADEWFFRALFEVEKLKEEFDIKYPGKFVYADWRKCDKSVENFLSAKFNLRGIPLAYFIRKDDAPVTIMSDDVSYAADPEDFHINAAPLSGTVSNRYNVKVQKFLNSLTEDTKAWKWIEKSKGGRDYMKELRVHYY